MLTVAPTRNQVLYNRIVDDTLRPIFLDLSRAGRIAGAESLDVDFHPAGAVDAWIRLPKNRAMQWKYITVFLFTDKDRAKDAESVADALKGKVKEVHRCDDTQGLVQLYPWLSIGDRRCSWPSEMFKDFLFAGKTKTAMDIRNLQALGITHVVSLHSDIATEQCSQDELVNAGVLEHQACIDGTLEADLSGVFDACNNFVEQARSAGGRVLVHCESGSSLSASVVIAYTLFSCTEMDHNIDRALQFVIDRRPTTVIDDGLIKHIQHWQASALLENT